MAGMSVSLIVAGAYERFGTEAQKQDMLGAIARGDVMAIAMSEPEAGSDVGALKCKAVREGDTYRITGHKTWISAAHVAERILLICRTDASGSKHEGITMLEVPANAPGMEIRGIQTMGGKEVNDVWFDDVVVPAENLLGQEGGGWMQLMAGLNVERLIIAANMLGLAQRAFDDVLAYVKERKQFGRPIGSFQVAQAPPRRPRDRDRVRAPADLRRRAPRRRRPDGAVPEGGVDGEDQGHRGRQDGHARGHADDGRLRLRDRVRHGVASSAPRSSRRSTAGPTRSSGRSCSKTLGL